MANFEQIIPFTRGWEGGYVNDPSDSGKETYCGISREHWPDWEGWPLVDLAKPLDTGAIIEDKVLEEMVNTFYYVTKWKDIAGDGIVSKKVAAALFDYQVHSGDIATRALQGIVGVKQDGVIGPVTLKAINSQPENLLFTRLMENRIDFLTRLAARRAKDQKFLKGWLRRVNELKKTFF